MREATQPHVTFLGKGKVRNRRCHIQPLTLLFKLQWYRKYKNRHQLRKASETCALLYQRWCRRRFTTRGMEVITTLSPRSKDSKTFDHDHDHGLDLPIVEALITLSSPGEFCRTIIITLLSPHHHRGEPIVSFHNPTSNTLLKKNHLQVMEIIPCLHVRSVKPPMAITVMNRASVDPLCVCICHVGGA